MTGAAEVKALIALTLTEPRQAARRLMAMNLPAEARWLGLGLVVVMTMLTLQLIRLVLPDADPSPFGAAMGHPVSGFAFQAGSILVVSAVMAGAGRLFGGQGRFQDALLLMVWLEFVLALIAVLQLLLILVLPVAASILSIVALGLFLWLMVQFSAALHGFANLWAVLAGMVASFLVLVVAMALILAFLGLDPAVIMGMGAG